LDLEFDVGSLYEFVVEFSNNIHSNTLLIRGSKLLAIFNIGFFCISNGFQYRNPKLHF